MLGADTDEKTGFKTKAGDFPPLARARHVRLLARFMKAAQAVFARVASTPLRARRTEKGKGKGASGRSPHQLRADLKRAANRKAKLQSLKQRNAKAEPRRPPDPPNPKPRPT